MMLKIRIKSMTEAQQRILPAAIWRSISRLIKGWNGGWVSGTA